MCISWHGSRVACGRSSRPLRDYAGSGTRPESARIDPRRGLGVLRHAVDHEKLLRGALSWHPAYRAYDNHLGESIMGLDTEDVRQAVRRGMRGRRQRGCASDVLRGWGRSGPRPAIGYRRSLRSSSGPNLDSVRQSTALASLRSGQTSWISLGAGIDCFLAAREVGPRAGDRRGHDAEMVSRAANAARAASTTWNSGWARSRPSRSPTAAWTLISNCVLNLSPEKERSCPRRSAS